MKEAICRLRWERRNVNEDEAANAGKYLSYKLAHNNSTKLSALFFSILVHCFLLYSNVFCSILFYSILVFYVLFNNFVRSFLGTMQMTSQQSLYV